MIPLAMRLPSHLPGRWKKMMLTSRLVTLRQPGRLLSSFGVWIRIGLIGMPTLKRLVFDDAARCWRLELIARPTHPRGTDSTICFVAATFACVRHDTAPVASTARLF